MLFDQSDRSISLIACRIYRQAADAQARLYGGTRGGTGVGASVWENEQVRQKACPSSWKPVKQRSNLSQSDCSIPEPHCFSTNQIAALASLLVGFTGKREVETEVAAMVGMPVMTHGIRIRLVKVRSFS